MYVGLEESLFDLSGAVTIYVKFKPTKHYAFFILIFVKCSIQKWEKEAVLKF